MTVPKRHRVVYFVWPGLKGEILLMSTVQCQAFLRLQVVEKITGETPLRSEKRLRIKMCGLLGVCQNQKDMLKSIMNFLQALLITVIRVTSVSIKTTDTEIRSGKSSTCPKYK